MSEVHGVEEQDNEAALLTHQPCDDCGSSDAKSYYSSGWAHCFSCEKNSKHDLAGVTAEVPESGARPARGLLSGEFGEIRARFLTEETCRRFHYLRGTDEAGRPCQLATYYDDKGAPVAQKVRYPNKDFHWVGSPKKARLFGQQLCRGGGKRIAVTEGEIDAMSLSQALNHRWNVVSVSGGAGGAKKELAKHLVWLEGFDEIVLCFDNDDEGAKAIKECAPLFSPKKVRIMSLPRKDANDMLCHSEVGQLIRAFWDAAPYQPAEVIAGEDMWELVSSDPDFGLAYPWQCFQPVTYGLRRGEMVTFTAGTGIGKSQFVREVIHYLAMEHQQRVGVIALEESVRLAGLSQMSLYANKRLHVPDVWQSTSSEQLREYYDATLGSGRFTFVNHFGSVAAKEILPLLRYLVLGRDCRWIVLDHISIMVSGDASQGDERKRIDELVTALRTVVEELDFGLLIVSHLRKAHGTPHEEGGRVTLGDLRGSGAIAQLSDMVIALERNQQSEDEEHITTARMLKNRKFGTTGVMGRLEYSMETGRIREAQALMDEASNVNHGDTDVSDEGEDF